MENGFLVEIYNWLFSYFFAGDLPAIMAPVAEELCVILSFVVLAFAFAPVVIVLICLYRFLSSFARF